LILEFSEFDSPDFDFYMNFKPFDIDIDIDIDMNLKRTHRFSAPHKGVLCFSP